MIWAKLVWGLTLAGVLGWTFHRAWRWEHGAKADLIFPKYGKETFVFVLPTVLFWILLVFLVVFLWQCGVSKGLTRFGALCADVMLILSVYFVVLMALLPLLRRCFSARACAVLWLVPAFLTWQANALIQTLPLPRRTIYVPRSALPVIGAVWLAGFLAVGGYYLISHLRFRIWVSRNTEIDMDAETRAVWVREREALEYRRPVTLLRGDVPAPFSMGRTKASRCTVLPKRAYTEEELTMIFRHELHHLQRCDVDTKVFLCLCNAFCWFNPLVWIATRRGAEDLERSCDEIVTEDMDEAGRRAYARLLLDAAAPGRGCTTCLSAAAGTLRYRLKGVMERRRRLLGTLLLMAALLSCVMSFGVVSFSDERGSFTELLLPEGTVIVNIYHPEGKAVAWDDAALRTALEGVKLEHVADLRNPANSEERIDFLLSDGGVVVAYLSERAVIVHDYRRAPGSVDCYLVRNPVDLDALAAAIAA